MEVISVVLLFVRSISLVGEKERGLMKSILRQSHCPVKKRFIPPGKTYSFIYCTAVVVFGILSLLSYMYVRVLKLTCACVFRGDQCLQ